MMIVDNVTNNNVTKSDNCFVWTHKSKMLAHRGRAQRQRLQYLYSPSCRELDFSHLQAKGLEIRSSAQYASSADQGAYHHPPPTDYNDALYGPFTPLSQKASSNTSRFLIRRATFCMSLRQTEPQKVPRPS